LRVEGCELRGKTSTKSEIRRVPCDGFRKGLRGLDLRTAGFGGGRFCPGLGPKPAGLRWLAWGGGDRGCCEEEVLEDGVELSFHGGVVGEGLGG
jgi:hypothetical protein